MIYLPSPKVLDTDRLYDLWLSEIDWVIYWNWAKIAKWRQPHYSPSGSCKSNKCNLAMIVSFAGRLETVAKGATFKISSF